MMGIFAWLTRPNGDVFGQMSDTRGFQGKQARPLMRTKEVFLSRGLATTRIYNKAQPQQTLPLRQTHTSDAGLALVAG